MEQESFAFAPCVGVTFLGHVDCGKSTLIGRIAAMHDVHTWNRVVEQYASEADEIGKASFSWAFVVDKTRGERERGITIRRTTLPLKISLGKARWSDPKNLVNKEEGIPSWHSCTLLLHNVGGHVDFLRTMTSASVGLSRVHVIVVAANRGEFEAGLDSYKRSLSLAVVGCGRIVIAVNKMDSNDEGRFREIERELLRAYSLICGKKAEDVAVVPVSAWCGYNLMSPPPSRGRGPLRKIGKQWLVRDPFGENDRPFPWYNGPSLEEAIHSAVARSMGRSVDAKIRFGEWKEYVPRLEWFAGRACWFHLPWNSVRVLPRVLRKVVGWAGSTVEEPNVNDKKAYRKVKTKLIADTAFSVPLFVLDWHYVRGHFVVVGKVGSELAVGDVVAILSGSPLEPNEYTITSLQVFGTNVDHVGPGQIAGAVLLPRIRFRLGNTRHGIAIMHPHPYIQADHCDGARAVALLAEASKKETFPRDDLLPCGIVIGQAAVTGRRRMDMWSQSVCLRHSVGWSPLVVSGCSSMPGSFIRFHFLSDEGELKEAFPVCGGRSLRKTIVACFALAPGLIRLGRLHWERRYREGVNSVRGRLFASAGSRLMLLDSRRDHGVMKVFATIPLLPAGIVHFFKAYHPCEEWDKLVPALERALSYRVAVRVLRGGTSFSLSVPVARFRTVQGWCPLHLAVMRRSPVLVRCALKATLEHPVEHFGDDTFPDRAALLVKNDTSSRALLEVFDALGFMLTKINTVEEMRTMDGQNLNAVELALRCESEEILALLRKELGKK